MKKVLLFVVLSFAAVVCFAHGDHAPRVAACIAKDCTKEEVEAAVPQAVELLVKKGKIDNSWTTIKVEKVEQKEFKKGKEWVATLFDEKQKDTSKQRLYVFITLKGYLGGSNFSGN